MLRPSIHNVSTRAHSPTGDIDEALRFVCLPLGLKYEILSAGKIRIYKELNV